jgi:cation diffusion facilitator family transporter
MAMNIALRLQLGLVLAVSVSRKPPTRRLGYTEHTRSTTIAAERRVSHSHSHVAPEATTDERAIRAARLATFGLLATALLQLAIVAMGRSAALFADALHNLGDVSTTVALWIAFLVSRRAASRAYTFGFSRVEDLAGVFIVLVILGSAALAGWESLAKFRSGEAPSFVALSMVAALVGVAGNEIVALYKIRVGREINSASLVADGLHSRIDGLASLAAFLGLGGVALGYNRADPIAGLLITVVIAWVAVGAIREVAGRLLDRIDPEIVHQIEHIAGAVPGVQRVHDLRMRWAGHSLLAILAIELDPSLRLDEAHAIAEEVRHELLDHVKGLVTVDVHMDPAGDAHEKTAHHARGIAFTSGPSPDAGRGEPRHTGGEGPQPPSVVER